MAEGKFPGVEHLARKISGAFAAINFIAEHGMSEVMQMNADLMGPPGVNRAFNETHVAVRFENAIIGFRRAPPPSRNTHSLPVDRVAGDRRVDRPGFLAWRAGDEREIGFSGGAFGKLL